MSRGLIIKQSGKRVDVEFNNFLWADFGNFFNFNATFLN